MRRNHRAVRQPIGPLCSTRVTVSVIVPCYNYGGFLSECVQSILSQEGVLVDVLIIDDASTDNTNAVAQSLAAQDSRVSLITHDQNAGHIATYNEGLALAKGKYCLLLSADDLLTAGALSRATSLMEAHPTVGLVYGNVVSFVGPPLPIPRTEPTGWTIWQGPDWIYILCQLVTNVLASPEVVLRTDLQHKIGGYSSDLPHSGDMEMWMRAAASGGIGRIDSADQAYYRTHPKSMSRSQYYTIALKDLRERRSAFESAFNGAVGSVPRASELRRLAMRSLAGEAIDATTLKQLPKLGVPVDEPEQVESSIGFAVETYPEVTRSIRYRLILARVSGKTFISRGIGRRIDRVGVRVWNAYRRRRRNALLRKIVSI